MPGPLSKDLRQRVIEAVASGASRRQAARRFGVSASAAVRWLAAWHAEGRVAPLAMGGDRRSSLDRHRELLLEMIAARPDTTLDEMRAMLATQGIITSHGALWRFFAKEGLSFKKKTVHASEQERPDVKKAREAWLEGQVELASGKLVFIDETPPSIPMGSRPTWPAFVAVRRAVHA